ncbi:hypothetical protein [Montanilutibacter psychrotolerans]|uniref:Uncharacterized protein n=1 Tax=Montanilutibacter psychrotolerans TaxID=1327343 RepID=A0A3M8ST07_9GAMM|nr:hypothetical protein [Lysobacter psychrotolerans]RNF84441.1 hypothetical protein EER27_08695 [Lysobacter psychrotolerans]
MKGRHTLKVVVVMALVSAVGIMGLLLVDGALDWLLLVLAALPLVVGLWCWRKESSTAPRSRA